MQNYIVYFSFNRCGYIDKKNSTTVEASSFSQAVENFYKFINFYNLSDVLVTGVRSEFDFSDMGECENNLVSKDEVKEIYAALA